MRVVDLSQCPRGFIEAMNDASKIGLDQILRAAQIGLMDEATDKSFRRWFLDIRRPIADSQCELVSMIEALQTRHGLTAAEIQSRCEGKRSDTGDVLELQINVAMYATARLVMEDLIRVAQHAARLEEENQKVLGRPPITPN